MFCPKCGKKNKEEAKFCEFCGSRIREDKVILPKERKKLSKKTKIIVIVICALVLILGGGVLFLSNNSKPSKVATDYFLAYINDDTNKIYSFLDVPNSGLTSKQIFNKVFDNDDEDLISYEVVSVTEAKEASTAYVKIEYTLEDSRASKVANIKLTKDKNKKFLIFDNWKIDTNSYLKENYEIKVPKDATLMLEGIKIDKEYKKSSDNYDTYIIPQMFQGEYEAIITLKDGLKLKQEINTNSYRTGKIKLLDNDEKELEKKILETINNLYKNAIEGKNFNDIKSEFEYKNSDLSDLENNYSSLANSVKYNELKEFTIEEVDIEDISVDGSGKLKVTVDLDYNYTVKKYLSDETVSKDADDTAYLTFDYIDGFKLVNMTSLPSYFSRF